MNYCKNHGKSSGKLPGVISKQAIHTRTMSSRIMPFIFNMDAYPDQTKHRMWDDACSNSLQLFRQIIATFSLFRSGFYILAVVQP